MNHFRASQVSLPDRVSRAIRQLIAEANESDLPIIDVTAAAAKLAGIMPEAAALGVERLSAEIVDQASRDSRVGLTISADA